jgi:tRNA threonylcarbamoyladenosine modification (KEOPS) complex  Pcc1 subunit
MECTIKAEFPDEEAAKAAVKAVSHERHAGGRSSAKVASSGRALTITIEAADVVALRAAANAYLRALAVFEGIEKG